MDVLPFADVRVVLDQSVRDELKLNGVPVGSSWRLLSHILSNLHVDQLWCCSRKLGRSIEVCLLRTGAPKNINFGDNLGYFFLIIITI